jgi:hypothetical protein
MYHYPQYDQDTYKLKNVKSYPDKNTCNNVSLVPPKCANEEKTVTHDFKVILGECKVKRNVKITHCVVANVEHTINENIVCKHAPTTKYTTSTKNTVNNGHKCNVKIKDSTPDCNSHPKHDHECDTHEHTNQHNAPYKRKHKSNESTNPIEHTRKHCTKYNKTKHAVSSDSCSTNTQSTQYTVKDKCMHVTLNSEVPSNNTHPQFKHIKPEFIKSNSYVASSKCKKTLPVKLTNNIEQIVTNSQSDDLSLDKYSNNHIKTSTHQVCI